MHSKAHCHILLSRMQTQVYTTGALVGQSRSRLSKRKCLPAVWSDDHLVELVGNWIKADPICPVWFHTRTHTRTPLNLIPLRLPGLIEWYLMCPQVVQIHRWLQVDFWSSWMICHFLICFVLLPVFPQQAFGRKTHKTQKNHTFFVLFFVVWVVFFFVSWWQNQGKCTAEYETLFHAHRLI